MITQTGRKRKNDRFHETVQRNKRQSGTHKLASIRPVVVETNRERMYRAGQRTTISIVDYRTDGIGPQFSIGGATHKWSMTTADNLTTFRSAHGTTVTVNAANVEKLINKLPSPKQESLMSYTTPIEHSFVNGWTGEVHETLDLTPAQAEEKNHPLKMKNLDFRWVPADQVHTVSAWRLNTDGTTRVMTDSEALEYNTVFERQDMVRRQHGCVLLKRRWEKMDWTLVHHDLQYFI